MPFKRGHVDAGPHGNNAHLDVNFTATSQLLTPVLLLLLLLLLLVRCRLPPNAFRNEGMTMQARIAAMKEQNWLKPPAATALQANHTELFQTVA
jgi:hypothetical protein